MHAKLSELQMSLMAVVEAIRNQANQFTPLNTEQGGQVVALTLNDVANSVHSVSDIIANNSRDEISEDLADKINYWVSGLYYLKDNTVPYIRNGNASQMVPAIYITAEIIGKNLEHALVRDDSKEIQKRTSSARSKIQALESRINDLDTRSSSMDDLVFRILGAADAADQLPTDLEELGKARKNIQKLQDESSQDYGRISDFKKAAQEIDTTLKTSESEAKLVLEEIGKAYSAATSLGLGKAFDDKSKSLERSMWFWVFALAAALAFGLFYGSRQLSSLTDVISMPQMPVAAIALNMLLSLLSIGASVWFSWVATKQIGQRFRLSEDYAFKASISKAYEGYRREAARIDPDLEAKLLQSALARLDELPLRLVETDTHGSPWHELASSELVKNAVNTIPGFAGQVKELANKTLGVLPQAKSNKEKAEES